ncbi:EMILIN-3-like [Stigmatopora argus]
MNLLAVLLAAAASTLLLSSADAKRWPAGERRYGTGRHGNHCAYVLEKTLSFTLRDGTLPYVKAEYNRRCSWHPKCPTLTYRLLSKPVYKVGHKTVTALEWRCCPGYSGAGCAEEAEGPASVKSGPPFRGPPFDPFVPARGGRPFPPFVPAHPWNGARGRSAVAPGVFPAPHFGPPPSFSAFPAEVGEREEERGGRHWAVAEDTRESTADGETEERICGMEEDIRRLKRSLETLKGTVGGLEDSLRASLREDAEWTLSALPSTSAAVGLAEIPGAPPPAGASDVSPAEPDARPEGLGGRPLPETAEPRAVPGRETERLLDARLAAARTEILDALEKRAEGVEGRCRERAEDVRRHCRRESGRERERAREALAERTGDLSSETERLRERLARLDGAESRCAEVGGLSRRLLALETALAGLNRSQEHLRVELGDHKDHVEGMLEGRLRFLDSPTGGPGPNPNPVSPEAGMDGGLREPEEGLLAALEELRNASVSALLEGRAVPAPDADLESLRDRLETEVDRVQKRLGHLETLCWSSRSDTPSPRSADERRLGRGGQRGPGREAGGPAGQGRDAGRLAGLGRDVGRVQRALRGLEGSLGSLVQRVVLLNGSRHESESRLADQMKGLVRLAGRQASMLGARERKLTRLKGELRESGRRLFERVRGCRDAAEGARREAAEVGGRLARAEDRCEAAARPGDLRQALAGLARDLEKVGGEAELKEPTGDCVAKDDSATPSTAPGSPRGDTFASE